MGDFFFSAAKSEKEMPHLDMLEHVVGWYMITMR